MLQHIECPHCHAPNLTAESVCFACGAALKPSRKAHGFRPVEAPWALWLALILALCVGAFAAWHLASWIAGYRTRLAVAAWHLPVAGVGLVAAGQLAFWQARRRDRRRWRLRRAPELNVSQAHVGDVVWTRGRLECDTPLPIPYATDLCAYYRYSLRERDPDESWWRVTERDTRAVDFRLADGDDSIYVPSGAVLFDAPLYVETFVDPGATIQARVWAFPVGLPVSLCGHLAGDTKRPRMDPLGEDLPVVLTWRTPRDYVALVARRARGAYLLAWTLTFLGALAFIAGVATI
jgi:hypothetical protein